MSNKQIKTYIMKYLFIDIRKSDEVYSKHFAHDKNTKIYDEPYLNFK